VRESRKKVVTQEAIRKQEVGSWGGGGEMNYNWITRIAALCLNGGVPQRVGGCKESVN